MLELSLVHFCIAVTAAFLIGFSKGGMKGISVLYITLMAVVIGAKNSTGIILAFLMLGDLMAVIYFKRHVRWNFLFKLLPWMILGVLAGVYLGKDLPEATFELIFAVVIIFSVFMMIWWEKKKEASIPRQPWFAALMGLSAGVTTMIGNLAGAFTNIYFLSIRIPKNEFIGTAAWLYFLINIFKFPFHFFVWGTITVETLKFNLCLAPAVCLGFFVGIKVVNRINEVFYRRMIIALTIVGVFIILSK